MEQGTVLGTEGITQERTDGLRKRWRMIRKESQWTPTRTGEGGRSTGSW